MKEARILLVEDQETEVEKFKDVLEMLSDHRVVEVATSLKSARISMQRLCVGILGADVVVLDGNLSAESKNGNDAAILIHEARQAAIDVPIIGNSAQPMSEYGLTVTADATKDLDRLIDILDELPEPA